MTLTPAPPVQPGGATGWHLAVPASADVSHPIPTLKIDDANVV